MTEWDAMADYLEEHGQPEWAAKAREQSVREEAWEKAAGEIRRNITGSITWSGTALEQVGRRWIIGPAAP